MAWTPIDARDSLWSGDTPVTITDVITDVASYDDLADALTAIGSNNRTLYITNEQTISSAVTIPANVHIVVVKGGSFLKAASGTLTFSGPFSAGLYQVFSGFSAGDVTGLTEAYGAWFGTVGDGVTSDSSALNVAASAVRTKMGTLHIPAGTIHRLTAEVDATNVHIEGSHKDNSGFFIDFVGVGISAGKLTSGTDEFLIKNCRVWGASTFDWSTTPVAGKIGVLVQQSHLGKIKNCDFAFLDYGVRVSRTSYYGVVKTNRFRKNNVSVHLLSESNGVPNEQNIIFNQFDVWPASVGGPGTTIGVKVEGVISYGVNHTKILCNGFENLYIGIVLVNSQGTEMLFNRFEDVSSYYITADGDCLENVILGGHTVYPADKLDIYNVGASYNAILPNRVLPHTVKPIVTISGPAQTVSVDASAGKYQQITVSTTDAFTIANPTKKQPGIELSFIIYNGSGGSMGTITWGTQYVLQGAFTNPANGKMRSIHFFTLDGTYWREISRTTTDSD